MCNEKNITNKRAFTDEEVISLRQEYLKAPFKLRERAKELNISHVTLSLLLRGKTYSNLPYAVETKAFKGKRPPTRTVDMFLAYQTLKIMKLTSIEAGKLLNCHPITVWKRLKKYDESKYYSHRKKFIEKFKDKPKLLARFNMRPPI